MQFKTHQEKLVRLQTSQNRDLEKGIILDRNERADSYNNSDFKIEIEANKKEKKLIFPIAYHSFRIRILKGENLCYILQPQR